METFFYVCGSGNSEAELKELLLRRYNSYSFIYDMTLPEFCEFMEVVYDKEKEEKMREQWLAMLPKFNKYIEFSEFEDMMTGANIDRRSNSEIIAEVLALHPELGGHL